MRPLVPHAHQGVYYFLYKIVIYLLYVVFFNRKSKIPIGEGGRKRSLSTEPKSLTKKSIAPSSAKPQVLFRRSRSAATLCATPVATPVRLVSGSISKRSPRSHVKHSAIRGDQDKQNKINEQSAALLKYLVENKLPVPNGPLKQMSVAQFISYVQHFVTLLTASKVKITTINYIDVIFKLTKNFKYKGQISRSILLAPNTMHSWPHALTLLTWFRVMCEGLFESNTSYLSDDTENQKMIHIMEFMYRMYEFWNIGNDPEVERVLEECIAELSTSEQADEQIKASLLQEKSKEEQLKRILAEKQKENENLKNQKESFMQLQQDLYDNEEKRQLLSDKITQLKTVKERAVQAVKNMQNENKEIQTQIKTQPMNKTQLAELEHQINMYIDKINNNKKLKQKHIEHNLEYNLQLKKMSTNLSDKLVEYKSLIYKIYEYHTILGIKFNIEELDISLNIVHNIPKLNETLCEKKTILQNYLQILEQEHLKYINARSNLLADIEKQKQYADNFVQKLELRRTELEDLKVEVKKKEDVINDFHNILENTKAEAQKIKQQHANKKDELAKYEITVNESLQKLDEAKRSLVELKQENMKFMKKKFEFFEKEMLANRNNIIEVHDAMIGFDARIIAFLESMKNLR